MFNFNNKNYINALNKFTNAADRGNALAQTQLRYMYEMGLGVNMDRTIALRWYLQATSINYYFAQYKAGTIYYNGFGNVIPRDF